MTEPNAQSEPAPEHAAPVPPASAAADAATPPPRSLLARINTFCAVAPLGAFVALHTALNARMVYGRRAFNAAYGAVQDLPWLPVVEVALVALPLAFHAVYGLAQTLRGGGPSPRRDPSLRTWLTVLQRSTGVLALLFVAVHVWQYRAQRALRGAPWVELYQRLGVDLNAPVRYGVYAAGVSAVTFHLAYGVHLALGRSRLLRSPAAARRSAWACGLVGVALWALGINTLLHFAALCGGVLPLPGRHLAQLCVGTAR